MRKSLRLFFINLDAPTEGCPVLGRHLRNIKIYMKSLISLNQKKLALCALGIYMVKKRILWGVETFI